MAEIDFRQVRFFVEGNDRVFLRDFLWFAYGQTFTAPQLKDLIQDCKGFTNLHLFKKEFDETKQDQKRDGGINIVIFDADYDGREEYHGYSKKLAYLNTKKIELEIDFEVFLWPDNQHDGTLETILESCINPQHQSILNCWKDLEICVNKQKQGSYTIPANKSKMYFYLECLYGETNKEKDKIKDPNRDFKETDKWVFDFERNQNLKKLKETLDLLMPKK